MDLSVQKRKRIFIFLLIPVLIFILLITDDLWLRVISGLILVIYVAFIIFLRDSNKSAPDEEIKVAEPVEPVDKSAAQTDRFDTDYGEEFKIVSPNKTIEIITADNFGPSVNRGNKEVFKPSDFKENFQKIVNEELPKDVNQDEQFGFVLEKILSVVKESFMAHSAMFFWYNKNRKRLTLERYVSSCSQIAKQ